MDLKYALEKAEEPTDILLNSKADKSPSAYRERFNCEIVMQNAPRLTIKRQLPIIDLSDDEDLPLDASNPSVMFSTNELNSSEDMNSSLYACALTNRGSLIRDINDNRSPQLKSRLCGAAKKRFRFFLFKGYRWEEARKLAQFPMKQNKNLHTKEKNKKSNISGSRVWSARSRLPPVEQYVVPDAREELPCVESTSRSRSSRSPAYQDVDDDIKLCILPADYPRSLWTNEQLGHIQKEILYLIRHQNNCDIVKPNFSKCTFNSGYLTIVCGDAATADWLKASASLLKLERCSSPMIVPEAEIPRPFIFVGQFEETSKTSNSDILKLIDGQNRDLRVNYWKILEREVKGTKMEITISVDPISADVLKENRYNISYAFGQVSMRPKENHVSLPRRTTSVSPASSTYRRQNSERRNHSIKNDRVNISKNKRNVEFNYLSMPSSIKNHNRRSITRSRSRSRKYDNRSAPNNNRRSSVEGRRRH